MYMLHGLAYMIVKLWNLCSTLCCTVKVTVLTVTSAVTWLWQSCSVMSLSNPEMVCPCPTAKVTVVMVMSASNPDVTSSIVHMLEDSTTNAWPNQLDDGYMWVWVIVGLLDYYGRHKWQHYKPIFFNTLWTQLPTTPCSASGMLLTTTRNHPWPICPKNADMVSTWAAVFQLPTESSKVASHPAHPQYLHILWPQNSARQWPPTTLRNPVTLHQCVSSLYTIVLER